MGVEKYSNFTLLNYRKKKSGLSKTQVDFLMSIYEVNKKPTSFQRSGIAEKLGISEDKVRNWFQNKRAKDKRTNKSETNTSFVKNGVSLSENIHPRCNDLYKKRGEHGFQ